MRLGSRKFSVREERGEGFAGMKGSRSERRFSGRLKSAGRVEYRGGALREKVEQG